MCPYEHKNHENILPAFQQLLFSIPDIVNSPSSKPSENDDNWIDGCAHMYKDEEEPECKVQ